MICSLLYNFVINIVALLLSILLLFIFSYLIAVSSQLFLSLPVIFLPFVPSVLLSIPPQGGKEVGVVAAHSCSGNTKLGNTRPKLQQVFGFFWHPR